MGNDHGQNGEPPKPRDYAVGYGKPPSATRFRKGHSGNPSGRRRGSKNLSTILNEELERRVVIRENGKQKTITKRRASMKQLANKAASGDHRALEILIGYLRDLEGRAGTVEEGPQLNEIDQQILGGILERYQKGGRNGGAGNGNE